MQKNLVHKYTVLVKVRTPAGAVGLSNEDLKLESEWLEFYSVIAWLGTAKCKCEDVDDNQFWLSFG